jgi:sulfofructose kinase
LCVGLVTQDVLLRVDEMPTKPEKLYARSRMMAGGGPAATAAVAVSRLGGRASIAGRIGDDPVGRALRRDLASEGVDDTWLRSFAGRQSSSSTVVVDRHGERLVIAYADPAMPAEPDWMTPAIAGGCVLADLSWPEGALKAFGAARQAGVPTLLDGDVSQHGRETVRALVAATDHVVFSRPGLAQLAGMDAVKDGLRSARMAHHRLVGVTDGAAGLYWLDGETLVQARPPAVEVVDTTGAGDAFHGAMALCLAGGHSLPQSIEVANTVAALKCTKPGGRNGLPTRTALAEFVPTLTLP